MSDGEPRPDLTRAERRSLLRGAAALAALGLGGCGFRPVYGGRGAAGDDAAVTADLAATRVPVIPDRFGQLLRRALVQRLGGAGAAGGTAPEGSGWELLVGPSLASEGIGIQRDGGASRVRTIATANWTLVRLTPREVVASGFERTTDAFNIQGSQFFAADASREAMERRLAEQLADEVVVRLAMQFRTLRAGGVAQRVAPVETPAPIPTPAPPASATLGLPEPGQGAIGGPTGGIGPRDGIR